MNWKEFKEKVESDIKLIRPEAKVDEMKINRIDIFMDNEISVGTDVNSDIIVEN